MKVDNESVLQPTSTTAEYQGIATAVCGRLAKNERVRRNLPGDGRLRIDRQLPFLCLHRGPLQHDRSTKELISTEAAYLFASDSPEHDAGLAYLCEAIISSMLEHFGMFLLIEVRAAQEAEQWTHDQLAFEIVAAEEANLPSTLEVLHEALRGIRVARQTARVAIRNDTDDTASVVSQQPQPLDERFGPTVQAALPGCCRLGLVVNPIYRDHDSGRVYPMVLQSLRWQMATALRKTIAEFTGSNRQKGASHYDSYGPSALVKAARMIDQQLCEVSASFDFLLQVTPTNAEAAWQQFKHSHYRQPPQLTYRHLPYHPNLLKRRLFSIEIERIEDPTLAYLFWEKQDEIDRQLTALRDLHLPEKTVGNRSQQSNFLLSSLQLYGGPEEALVALARRILKRAPAGKSSERPKRRARGRDRPADASPLVERVGAVELVRLAHEEIDLYHNRMNEFTATVELSDSIASGIMVSKDRLLISNDICISRQRITPLLHHEIGTHLLTYFNGRCQPFRQLYAGLAGYEELQEGLAVLAEYLVGGLTRQRIRTLAARVMAVHWMCRRESFVDVFAKLHNEHGFPRRQAFTTTLRVFRGGGLTKDVLYLRGLRDLLQYLSAEHDIDPLYVGKIGLPHVPYIQELRRRGIITSARILPRYLENDSVRERLDACRGKSVLDLMEND